MKQSRQQAMRNARRTASNKVNRTRGTRPAAMQNATGQPTQFRRQEGQFLSSSPQTTAAFAASRLIPFV
tara:strand:+ start:213 stop:419 length:207 start_codon:yes stop_codon:yes gene_type:complete